MTVENKISDISNVVKKTSYSTRISEIKMKITGHNHDKRIINSEFDNLTAKYFAARLVAANLVSLNKNL